MQGRGHPAHPLDAGKPELSSAIGSISCVVDAHPRFHLDALRWFGSLTRLAGVDPADLVIHVVGPAQTDSLRYLRARGVAVREIQQFDARSPHCNKISGALSLAAEKPRGLSVLTDSDVVIFEDPRTLEIPSDQVGMTPVHMANPPLAVLSTVFAAAGLPLPARTALQLQPEESTAAGNGNGGLYLVPGAVLPTVARAWAQWAGWLLARSELLAAWSVHVDQVAMALALAALGVKTFELDVRWNLPTHVAAIIPADPPSPAVIHYHQKVDAAGRLVPTGVAAIDRRIQDANDALGDVWRDEFPNATFWNWRYLTDPDLGSGAGSRDRPLHDKRELLAALLEILRPTSALDVGCGDGEATRGLPFTNYVGLDVSAEAVSRARAGRTDGDYRVGTLADHAVRADLVVCLDVLIHQADAAAYHDLVGRLLHCSARALVVSGYEQPIPDAFPTVHFHEPLSATIRRFAPDVEVYPLREQHRITTVLVLKALPGGDPRDQRAGPLTEIGGLLVRLAAVLGELQAQRAAAAAESSRPRCEIESLAEENQALREAQGRMSAELARWRDRVAAMEGTRAWKLRAWLLRRRRGRVPRP